MKIIFLIVFLVTSHVFAFGPYKIKPNKWVQVDVNLWEMFDRNGKCIWCCSESLCDRHGKGRPGTISKDEADLAMVSWLAKNKPQNLKYWTKP